MTPHAQERYEEQLARISGYKVKASSETVYFVWDSKVKPKRTRRVDVDVHTCSCAEMLQYRIPCRHYCAALDFIGGMGNVYAGFGKEYLVESYSAAYMGKSIELPLEEDVTADLTSLPAEMSTKRKQASKPGPKPQAQIASSGERLAPGTKVSRKRYKATGTAMVI